MTGYEKYQLQWMMEHGYSLGRLMEEIEGYCGFPESLAETFADWERDCGFDGEIWACEEEFLDCGEE